jgi:hypothetical protein
MTAPVNAELGQVSELFMLLASIAYVVALVFFVLDLVKSSPTIGSLEARLAGEQAVPARALAGVGSRGAGSCGRPRRTTPWTTDPGPGAGPRGSPSR